MVLKVKMSFCHLQGMICKGTVDTKLTWLVLGGVECS